MRLLIITDKLRSCVAKVRESFPLGNCTSGWKLFSNLVPTKVAEECVAPVINKGVLLQGQPLSQYINTH